MANPLYGVCNGLFVEDFRVAEPDIQLETLPNEAPQHLQLDLAHDLHLDLLALPGHVQLRVFLLQLQQFGKHHRRVRSRGQHQMIGHHRLGGHGRPPLSGTQHLACPGGCQAGDGQKGPGRGFVHGLKFFSGVQPQTQGLFRLCLPVTAHIAQPGAHREAASRDLHPGQPVPLGVPGDFIDPGSKFPRVLLLRPVGFQSFQQRFHALKLQRRPKEAGEELPGTNEPPQIPRGHRGPGQIAFQQRLIAQGRRLPEAFFILGKIHTAASEFLLKGPNQGLFFRPGQVHFIDE